MYRPRTAIIPGMGTVTPHGDVSAAEWLPVQEEALLSMTRTYDTRAFETIQDAIDAAHSNGGGTVFLGDSELSPQTLTLRDGVYLTGRGIGATKLKVNSIVGDGSVSQLPGLASSVARYARTVNFQSAHGLQPGDVFIIWDSTPGSFNAARTVYNAGEFCKVRTVESSTQVTLTTPTYDGYATGSAREIYKLNPIRTGVSNMTIECTTGVAGIRIEYGSDLEFSNLRMGGTDTNHIGLAKCYSVSVHRVSIFDHQAESGTNYGLIIGNSQRIRVSDCELETRRHGFTTGGGSSACNVPNRDIIVSDSYINGLSNAGGVCGCNLHGNSEFVRFENCTFPAGANPAGDKITYNNCDFGTPSWGSAISCMEMLGTSLTVTNCRFRATDDHLTDYGVMRFYFAETCNRGGVFTFAGNTVDFSGVAGDGVLTVAMYVLQTGELTNADFGGRFLNIKNNMFNTSSVTDRRAVRMRTGPAATDWVRVSFVDNDHNPQLVSTFHEMTSLVYFDGYGQAIPAFAAAPGSRYMRRVNPGVNEGKLYVNQDGSTTWTVK